MSEEKNNNELKDEIESVDNKVDELEERIIRTEQLLEDKNTEIEELKGMIQHLRDSIQSFSLETDDKLKAIWEEIK